MTDLNRRFHRAEIRRRAGDKIAFNGTAVVVIGAFIVAVAMACEMAR